MKKPKRSTDSTDTTPIFTQQSNELESNKKSKRILRNESTASTNKNLPITKKKTQVYSLFISQKKKVTLVI
jgi:hypothetical protein